MPADPGPVASAIDARGRVPFEYPEGSNARRPGFSADTGLITGSATNKDMAELPTVPGYRLLKVLKQSKRSRTFLAEQQSLARQVVESPEQEFFDEIPVCASAVDEGNPARRLNHPMCSPSSTLVLPELSPISPPSLCQVARCAIACSNRWRQSEPCASPGSGHALNTRIPGRGHRDIKPSNIMFRGRRSRSAGDLGILRRRAKPGACRSAVRTT